MNLYLRSVGLSQIKTKRQYNKLIKHITDNPDEQYILGKNSSDIYVEYYKYYGEKFGLILRGIIDEKEKIIIDKCYPFVVSNNNIPSENIESEVMDGDYIVISEDVCTGNEMVFLLQNVLELMEQDYSIQNIKNVNIAGLSISGTIILPVLKDDYSEKLRREEDAYYRELVNKAREGDAKAKELLDRQEAETSELMHERLLEEDFLSVVEGFFIPLDQDETSYTVLGDIEDLKEEYNKETGEKIFRLTLSITGTKIDILINPNDLMGVPSVGMRFMGSCWLQGKLLY